MTVLIEFVLVIIGVLIALRLINQFAEDRRVDRQQISFLNRTIPPQIDDANALIAARGSYIAAVR